MGRSSRRMKFMAASGRSGETRIETGRRVFYIFCKHARDLQKNIGKVQRLVTIRPDSCDLVFLFFFFFSSCRRFGEHDDCFVTVADSYRSSCRRVDSAESARNSQEHVENWNDRISRVSGIVTRNISFLETSAIFLWIGYLRFDILPVRLRNVMRF